MLNVKYLDSVKKIQIPSNLNDFILKVAHLFGINSDFDIFTKNDKIDFEVQILNQYDYDLNVQELINSNIYILIKNKYNFQSYFNLLNDNSKKLKEIESKIKDLIKDFDTISLNNQNNNNNNINNNNINNNNINNNNKNNNNRNNNNRNNNNRNNNNINYNNINYNNINYNNINNNNRNNNNRNNNNIVINPFNQNNFIDTNIKSDYSMIILNNNETLSVHVEKINSPSPYPIEFTIYIKNNNNNLTWPNDTILKCKNDNTEIFFYHCKWNQMKTNFNGEICYAFEIILNSKTKKIAVGKYSCRFFLISDSKGRIGNNFGQINLNVFERIEDMNEDDNVFMNRYSVGEGKIEYGKI